MKLKLSLWAFAAMALAFTLGIVLADSSVVHIATTALMSNPAETAGTFLMANGVAALDPEKVQAELKRIGDEVKAFAEKAMNEIKATGKLSEETRTNVDKVLLQQGELQVRLQATEQAVALLTAGGGKGADKPQSLGAMLVSSEEFQAYMKAGGMTSRNASFGLKINAALSSIGSAGDLVDPMRIPGIIPPGLRRMTIRDLMAPGRTDSNAIQYVKETGFTNNAATVSETVKKPESSLEFDLVNQTVVTIAHFIKASKQILDDAPQLQSYVDGRLRFGLDLVEETQLLKGSGVGNNLNGIYTQATAYSAPIDPPGTETRIDVIRLMLLQAELAEFPATGIVLHPSDWAAIELTKDTTGAYIFANPQSLAQPVLWGRPVVSTQAMTVDTALVGAFRQASQIFDREETNVVIATQNEDDFVKNMVTIRAEERLASAVYRPEAFIKNTNLP
jgi:HK97 family phage major capsid protein